MPVLRISVAVFLSIALLLLVFHGNRLVATNDEGILLDAAQRIAGGEKPYTDFWTYMSPGSYWLQAAVFRLAGVSLLAGRALVIFDFSLQCALLFWITTMLSSRRAAIAVLLAFLGFQIADPGFLTAQHRWDSSTLALAGVAVAISASRHWMWVAAGALIAAAAWCTPTAGLVGLAVAAWLAIDRERRGKIVPYIAGAAACSALAVGALAISGTLVPFLKQMIWLKQNYADVNGMPYGSIIGGYRTLFEGSGGAGGFLLRLLLVCCVALPAILPPVAIGVWGIALWRKKVPPELRPAAQLLVLAASAFVIGLMPRQDVMHLAFVAALPYALVGAAIARWVPARASVPFATFGLIMAATFGSNFFLTLRDTSPIATPVGTVRAPNSQIPGLRTLLASVHPGQGLFVYPYMPIHYFLTQARNPTVFSFFSPGMGTRREEMAAVAELQANPPQWVLNTTFSREEFLRVCPRGTGIDWHHPLIEDWLGKNFQPIEHPDTWVMGYQLWRRSGGNAEATAAALPPPR